MTVPHLDVSANTASRPSLHALANTTALGGQRFAEQDSADAVDEPHERVPRLDRTQALLVCQRGREHLEEMAVATRPPQTVPLEPL